MIELTPLQQAAVAAGQRSFLLGPAGAGKSTALHQRLLRLLGDGEPAYTLLVLVAEPEHGQSFLDALHHSGLGPYADLEITTYSNMAREMVALFWPLVARPAGFAHAYQPPAFLSYDLAQLLMWEIVTPMLTEGAFARLRLRPQQIVSQLLDTLNRAALNGLTLEQATARQMSAWVGDPDHLRHLQDAATAARRFRRFCLDNSLLDLSLAVQVFDTQLVKHPEFHKYFSERYRHLIVDNVEEQTPAGQNFVANLMDATQTTAIAYDAGGGYKRFLAADPTGANQFYGRCEHVFEFEERLTSSPGLIHLSNLAENYLMNTKQPTVEAEQAILGTVNGRYRREMIGHLVEALLERLEEGLPPREIAIIAPYLDGALRYNLAHALKEAGIPYFFLRRRSSPREEPRIRAWLTWLALAHPQWEIYPAAYDVAEALSLSIAGLDPARAELATERLYDPQVPALRPVDDLPERIAQRAGRDRLTLVEDLRLWLEEQGGDRHPIDTFLHRLFNTLLAQRRFQPEPDLAGAAVCEWLVRTAGRLRQAARPMGLETPAAVGRAFINGIYQGLVTADPPELGDPPDPDGVMISTIYGYLLAGRPVEVQVWLETAATGWWDIPRQPLSNAFVLAQSWRPERPWTMEEDYKIRNQLLSRIVRGLAARCTGGVILATSDLDRRGVRQ
ncbi:MAG: hypothetical protein L0331_01275, partial [Chloroflexi bacterium]|nr:hypothetical protein [Chloroflexota bacterium]